MGTIVYIDNTNKQNNYRIYTVIDGQQRLITLTLLLKALATVMSVKGSEHFKNEIGYIQSILTDTLNSYEGYKYKVKPGVKDINDYQNIFEKDDYSNKSSKVYNAYDHFYKTLLRYEAVDINQFYNNISKLKAVWIGIEENDGNPQSIFETINSSGVALTFTDLIRNYILLQESSENQKKLYETHWLSFENLLDTKMDSFIRSFLIMKRNVVFSKKDTYMVFKDYYNTEKEKKSSSNILIEMRRFADIYISLITGFKNEEKDDYEVFEIFNDLNYELSFPFLLRLIYDQKYNLTIEENDMLEIVNILSSYMFRKTVSSMNLTGVFANWIATLYPKISINEKILDNFIFEITNLNGKRLSFVTDDEFKTALTGAEVYNSNYKKYIIKKLESVQSKEKVLFDNLTVDHIIPQKLDINWKQRVAYNDKSRSEYSRIMHSLGNLTLTGYNSEKKNTDKDIFSDSNLLMNRKIDIKTFDLKSVENRTKEMVELALNIWPSPKLTVNNSSDNKNKIEINFFDIIIEDYEESPSKLHIGEKNYLIDDWNSLFQILTNEFSEYFSHTELKGNTNQKFNTVIDKLDSLSQDEIIRIEF